jgi:PBP1b-binding outer membrane lipoprotein LpoB
MKKNIILALSLTLLCAGCVIVVVEKPDQKTAKVTYTSTNSVTMTNTLPPTNTAAAH